jgi:hypothetical protein
VFVGDEVWLDVSFAVARARLASLVCGGLLDRASAQAYSGEITGLARVGPLGPVAGLSKVVRVHVRDLGAIGDSARFALRWEAAGPGGALFPALDADVTLASVGEHSTLTLGGVYRPPLGTAGGALDRAVMRRVATATIRAFLHQVAGAIAQPAGPAGSRAEALYPEPPALPAEPDQP